MTAIALRMKTNMIKAVIVLIVSTILVLMFSLD